MKEETDYPENEPMYECDYEYPCRCTEDGVEGEWTWYGSPYNHWQCSGCNDIQ